MTTILNEVLSLNAQESHSAGVKINPWLILNEVLSLNAQEYRSHSFIREGLVIPQ